MDLKSRLLILANSRRHGVRCTACGFEAEYFLRGGRVHEVIHVKKGEVPDMQTAKVVSDVIATVSLDTDQEPPVIVVTFRNGAVYEYKPRPDADPPDDMRVIYISFISADSAGKFFAANIRSVLPWRRKESAPKEAKR